jgi:hypothetical protein
MRQWQSIFKQKSSYTSEIKKTASWELEELPEVDFTIMETKKDNRVTERKMLLVRKKPIENRKASYSLIKTSIHS